MSRDVLVIDVGNTSVSAAWFRAGRVLSVRRLPTEAVRPRAAEAFLAGLPRPAECTGAAMASVVPRVDAVWESAVKRVFGVSLLRVRHTLSLGLRLDYPRPETIGADRLANSCGAVFRYGAPCVVADFGTGLTFDIVDRRPAYIGGVIAPGLPLMFSYLADKTALLPRIGPAPVRRRIGTSTEEAMRLGARWGYRGMVREILANLRKHPGLARARLVATGGYAAWVVRGLVPRWTLDPSLTLFGIGKIFELNHDRTR